MLVNFDGISINVLGDPATDGKKEFDVTDAFWEKWNQDAAKCKQHGFSIRFENNQYVGIYSPFAIYAEGTKRLYDERVEKSERILDEIEFYAQEGYYPDMEYTPRQIPTEPYVDPNYIDPWIYMLKYYQR